MVLKLRKLNEGDTSSLRLVNNDKKLFSAYYKMMLKTKFSCTFFGFFRRNIIVSPNNNSNLSMLSCLPDEIFNHICYFIESSRNDYPDYGYGATPYDFHISAPQLGYCAFLHNINGKAMSLLLLLLDNDSRNFGQQK